MFTSYKGTQGTLTRQLGTISYLPVLCLAMCMKVVLQLHTVHPFSFNSAHLYSQYTKKKRKGMTEGQIIEMDCIQNAGNFSLFFCMHERKEVISSSVLCWQIQRVFIRPLDLDSAQQFCSESTQELCCCIKSTNIIWPSWILYEDAFME